MNAITSLDPLVSADALAGGGAEIGKFHTVSAPSAKFHIRPKGGVVVHPIAKDASDPVEFDIARYNNVIAGVGLFRFGDCGKNTEAIRIGHMIARTAEGRKILLIGQVVALLHLINKIIGVEISKDHGIFVP